MKNLEDTSISLKVAVAILGVVVTGFFAGAVYAVKAAVWATNTDNRIAQVQEDVGLIKKRLGVESVKREPHPEKGPTPTIWVQEAKASP